MKLNELIFLFAFFSIVSVTRAQDTIFTKQPEGAVAPIGGSAEFSFTVRAPVAFANLGVYCYKNGAPASSRFTITSSNVATGLSLSGNYTEGAFTVRISNISSSDIGSYTFRASVNGAFYGDNSSQPAALTIGYVPTITKQPIALSVNLGNSANMSVEASSDLSLTYQWLKDGVNISGSTSSSYTLTSTKTSDDGSYTVVVSNRAGSATSNAAVLTIMAPPAFSLQPSTTTVSVGETLTLRVTATGSNPITYQWKKDGIAISGSAGSTYVITAAKISDAGSYSAVATNSIGSTSSSTAQLTVKELAPTISTQPSSSTIDAGKSASVTISASSNLSLSYQWKKDGAIISGATSSNYTIASTKTTDAGSYTVIVTNSIGSVTSNAATLTITAPRLSNLSVRTALDANQIVIVGITMSGGAKNVLFRAAGPTLSAFGVPDVMADPKLELFSGSTKVTTNDNWGGSSVISSAFQSVGAFAYSSTASLDAALVTSIDGGRTVQVSGPTAGTVLVEGYDAGSGDTQRFTNLSARNKVGTGANILIAGFTLTGSGTRNLLIRAVGPKLSDFGVTGVLADPKLEIYSGTTKLTENDNWSSSLATTFSSVGAFGLTAGSKDSAITVSLPAGGYTVQVSGADGGVGEAIVEIYELP